MNNNPFAIRKSPVEIIAAQAVALDDYVMRDDNGLGRAKARCEILFSNMQTKMLWISTGTTCAVPS